ncbi:hypothetical protein KAT08_02855 [Candidatus Babeliales bacterium]|nr:hypothetical protein [Candidatus Babeliales bacterium]
MKKIAFSIILLSFVSFGLIQCKKNPIVAKDISQQSLDELKNKMSELKNMFKKAEAEKTKNPTKKISEKIQYQILDKIKNISHFLFDQLKFVADKSDKIISKKFFIAAMLITAPAVSLYCKFFNPNFIKKIIEKISAIITHKAGDAGASATKGFFKGIAEMVWNNKLITALVVGGYVTITVTTGIVSVLGGKMFEVLGSELGSYVAKKLLPAVVEAAAK